ncbi:MAG TPA: hypothetical protein VF021_09990 [Longimicrobiales bacterium]
MRARFAAALGLAFLTGAVAGTRAEAQQTRVHILRSRPYTPADTTGLVHAPEQLTAVLVAGVPRDVGACAPHLRDTALNIDLLLIASFSNTSVTTSGDTVFTYRTTYGDYAPRTRRVYGLNDGEVVRVDCSRDRPVGRVRTRSAPLDRR